jgi:hypothetical protein
MVSIDDFVVTASSTFKGSPQNVLNYKIEELGSGTNDVFETDLEDGPLIEIDMGEGRFVKSIKIYGKEKNKLIGIHIAISTESKKGFN